MKTLKLIDKIFMIAQDLNKIYIIDFDDSFTYNIFSTLCEIDLKNQSRIEIIPFDKLETTIAKRRPSQFKTAYIFGPGPGRPEDYPSFKFDDITNSSNNLLFGICLGHQLYWKYKGLQTEASLNPMHGEAHQYDFGFLGFKTLQRVQRYNSLAVKIKADDISVLESNGWKLIVENNELIYAQNDRIISMQFHPESIGTTCPHLFFKPIGDFLL